MSAGTTRCQQLDWVIRDIHGIIRSNKLTNGETTIVLGTLASTIQRPENITLQVILADVCAMAKHADAMIAGNGGAS